MDISDSITSTSDQNQRPKEFIRMRRQMSFRLAIGIAAAALAAAGSQARQGGGSCSVCDETPGTVVTINCFGLCYSTPLADAKRCVVSNKCRNSVTWEFCDLPFCCDDEEEGGYYACLRVYDANCSPSSVCATRCCAAGATVTTSSALGCPGNFNQHLACNG